MQVTDELSLSIRSLKELYAKKETTPEKVVESIVNRAGQDKEMNIWITPPTMELAAPYLERLKTMDPVLSPLWGIPFAIKDNIDLANVPTTAGCEDYTYTPVEHATVVQRLIDAGAIPVGKTNMDQFATGLVGTRSPYGETSNALNPALISGGSSSGSAVAVARGQAAFSLGTDTAGSGRIPAALNNLTGFKPSLGAWPLKGVVPACASIDCVSVFAADLQEALQVDNVVRGLEKDDPWSKEIPHPGKILPEKICLPKQPVEFFGSYGEGYRMAWEKTIEKLESLNIPIEYIDFQPFAKSAEVLYGGPWVAERWSDLGEFIEANEGSALSVTEQVLRSGKTAGYDAASVFRALHDLQKYKLHAKKQLRNSVLVLPTAGGTWTREQVRKNPISANNDMGRYTNHCNLLDLSAVALPSGEAAFQVPFGITMFALSENESLLAGAADLFSSSGKSISKRTTKLEIPADTETIPIAVCGLHMRGFELEKQMLEFKARFIKETSTAAKYQFIKLPTFPPKPGLIKQKQGGSSIQVEVWEMPVREFGLFTAAIPAPLGIGKIELESGEEIPGFVCESYQVEEAEDITAAGSWRTVQKELFS